MARGVGFTYDKVRELCQKVTEETQICERSSLTNLDFRSEGFISAIPKNIEIEDWFAKNKILKEIVEGDGI